MKILIKRHEHEKLLAAINQFYRPFERSIAEIALIIQQLQDGIRLQIDIKITRHKVKHISKAIEFVYEMPVSEFIIQPDRLVLAERRGTIPQQLLLDSQYKKDSIEVNQTWEVTYCSDETGKEIVRKYSCEPSTQYLNSECRFLGANRCIVRVK
jgi:hypothetical protein